MAGLLNRLIIISNRLIRAKPYHAEGFVGANLAS